MRIINLADKLGIKAYPTQSGEILLVDWDIRTNSERFLKRFSEVVKWAKSLQKCHNVKLSEDGREISVGVFSYFEEAEWGDGWVWSEWFSIYEDYKAMTKAHVKSVAY